MNNEFPDWGEEVEAEVEVEDNNTNVPWVPNMSPNRSPISCVTDQSSISGNVVAMSWCHVYVSVLILF